MNSDLLNHYQSVRQYTVDFCKPLEIEDYVPQPVEFISPPKWHLAHTTWFFEEMVLSKFVESYERFDPDFAFLFNSYYNTVGKRTMRADRGNMTRPVVKRVYAYRDYVDAAMKDYLTQTNDEEAIKLIQLGLQHEQQHQELMHTDVKYVLGHNPLFPVYSAEKNLLKDHNEEMGWVDLKEGIYEIGFHGEGFSFDNEHGQHKVFLHEFSISKSLVTNGEFIEFIESGGYTQFNHWLDEGWWWVQKRGIEHPLYWHKIEGHWYVFTYAGLVPVDPDAILCHISFYEANAFATWKGMRLPTEFEWEAAADQFTWGKRWEWTNSAYLPYPQFQIADGAVGEYNGKFMVNQMVLRGASVATSPGHSRKTYRNFFHPYFQWQYSGIRLAK